MKYKLLNQVGDTMVEVLLALLIVSSVIAASYVSADRSLSGTRQSQERGEALKAAESQVEQIKSNVAVAVAATKIFCIDSVSGNAVIANSAPVGGIAFGSQPTLNSDTLTTYVATCKSGTIPYNIAIDRSGPDASNGYVFTVYVRWFRLASPSKDEVKIVYRAYP